MTVRTTAAEWTERVRAWRESGKSAPEFAASKGYPEKLLRWWSTELARRERKKPSVRLARVVRMPASVATMTVVVGAARVEVRPGFDRALLRQVIDALGGGR